MPRLSAVGISGLQAGEDVNGLILVVAGVLWPWLGRVPRGRLPGDLLWEGPPCRVTLPLASVLGIRVPLSLICWLFRP